jgi:hypothetical protein
MKKLLIAAYDWSMTRLNCCGVGVGCGCAIVVILPITGLIGVGTWAVLS